MLFADREVLAALWVTLQVAFVAVLVTTILGTLLGLGPRAAAAVAGRRGSADTLILLPMVTPEIVMGITLLLFFGVLFHANGSIGQIAIAHIAFSISYVAILVRSRAVSLDPRMEEAARDLGRVRAGASTSRCRCIAPAVAAGRDAGVRALVRRPDHHVVQRGRGVVDAAALHLLAIRFGVTPEINAISTIIVSVTAILIFLAWRLGALRGDQRSGATGI